MTNMIKENFSPLESALTATEVIKAQIGSTSENDYAAEISYKLRAVEPEDVDFMHEVENDVDAWIYSDNVAPLSREQLTAYAMTYTADPSIDGQLRLILEKRTHQITDSTSEIFEKHQGTAPCEPVGIVDLYDINPRHGHGFIGIYIKSSARGIGAGKEGVRQIARMAHRFLNLDVICAKVVDINEASLRFFNSCGFTLCGVVPAWLKIDGKRHDLHLFELDLSSLQGHEAH